MTIKALEWGNDNEKRIGTHATDGLPRVIPTLDIFGNPVHKPLNTVTLDNDPLHFIVLPNRPIKPDEWDEIRTVTGADAPPGIEAAPNGSEWVVNTDQSGEFIGTLPPAEPTAQPPIGYTGDGSVPVSDGTVSYPERESFDVQAPASEDTNTLPSKRSKFR